MEETLNQIKAALVSSFKRTEVKKAVLDPEWLKKNYEYGIDSTGFCYAASNVIYALTGGNANWKMKYISKKDWKEGTHYYLENRSTGDRVDITASQYLDRGLTIPYNLAKGTGVRNIPRKAKELARMCGLHGL